MARVLSTAFCVALLAATAAAFGVTEGAKTELSPIFHTRVPVKQFSPTCKCATRAAHFSFRLRKHEHLEVWMERDGRRVATLVAGKTYPRGTAHFVFTGRSDSGTRLPDGDYEPVVKLPHRTFDLPNELQLDTVAPKVDLIHASGRYSTFAVSYVLSESAHVVLLADGKQVEKQRFARQTGSLTWNGRIDGKPARVGAHQLEVVAIDGAGNRSQPVETTVTVRYLALARTRIVVRKGARFALLVLTGATQVDWRLNGQSGTTHGHTLKLRAPAKAGTYRLYVTAAGHSASATVVVR